MWLISPHPHLLTEMISGRSTCRSLGASRTLIQWFTSNMDISTRGPSTKSLARALHWDTQLYERLHKGKPAPGICREIPLKSLPELHEEQPKPKCSPQVSRTPLTPRSELPAQPSIAGPSNQSSNTLSTNAIQTSGEISPDVKGEQVKRKPCPVLKTDKQFSVPPGIFQHVIPPATSRSIHSGCWDFMVCSAPSN